MDKRLQLLKDEMSASPAGAFAPHYYRYLGYRQDMAAESGIARANGIASLFTRTRPFVYQNDLIAGSIRPLWTDTSPQELEYAKTIVNNFGERSFILNSDHYAPDYRRIISGGVPGLLCEIEASLAAHANEPEKLEYLQTMKTCVLAFREMILAYADCAKGQSNEFVFQNCRHIADRAPETLAQGLQLVWLCHTAFLYEGRYAMAFGRMDQYLYPLYKADLAAGRLTPEGALELLECTLIKIYESQAYSKLDDVVNICIGGTALDGSCDINELSYLILNAVKNCNVPGPNLSARISPDCPEEFLDACLEVIGTGLGYPALMNDRVNMAALSAYGYAAEDVCDYSMVGCIENFITGKQPPWSDGRFDTPRFFEYIFNRGKGILHPSVGLDTGDVSDIKSMDEFMEIFARQLAWGVDEYVMFFSNNNRRYNARQYRQPFLSCFCQDCIGRGLDINEGGAIYPSVHGAAVMGIGTVTDSLAAIEKVVFVDKSASLTEIGEALKTDFANAPELKAMLLAAPKYGNNMDFADKYAVWCVDTVSDLFKKHKTYDGGGIYIAMAANTSNIPAGRILAATPDGRNAGTPISDAASATYGRDVSGVTSTVLSLTKPDYTRAACGTVVNLKFFPEMFQGDSRKKLAALLRVYFQKGGQEVQINATSRQTLIAAMENPDMYRSLVVRVSGFSAFYVNLDKAVQTDILNRTQQKV